MYARTARNQQLGACEGAYTSVDVGGPPCHIGGESGVRLPPELCANPGHQFGELEGFGDVVDGSGIQADHDVESSSRAVSMITSSNGSSAWIL